jgi:hypothetical protein
MIESFSIRRSEKDAAVLKINIFQPAVEQHSTQVENVSSNTFHLKAFLKSMPTNWIPSNEHYKTILMFLVKHKFPAKSTSEYLNKRWNYTGNETYNFLCKYEDVDITVGVGSMIDILKNNADKEWDERIIFPRKKSIYYNEFTKLTGKTCYMHEVETFLRDIVKFSFKDKKFVWKILINARLDNVCIQMSKHPPFSGTDDFYINLFPSKAELHKKITKLIPKKVLSSDPQFVWYGKLRKIIKEINEGKKNIKELLALCEDIISVESLCTHKQMEKLLTHTHLQLKIPRFTCINFVPYVYEDPTRSLNIINTFSGFPLLKYTPTQKIDVKETLLYEYFRDVWGGGKVDDVVEDMWNRFSWRITNPNIRSERITILRSEKQGLGKSFCAQIWKALLSDELVQFHINLKSYVQDFNIHNNSKLIHFCDDLQSCTRAQVRALFPMATCNQQVYEAKGERSITLNEFSDIWVTGNDEVVLMIKNGDRRQLVYEAYDLWERNYNKFKSLAAVLKCRDTMHAWFHFFLNRDLGEWNPNMDVPSSKKAECILACAPKSHLFISTFFAEDDWYLRGKPPMEMHSRWTEMYEIKKNATFRIEKKRMYELYKYFMKTEFPKSDCRNNNTFYNELEKLEIIPWKKRRKINGRNKHGFDILASDIKRKMKTLYPTTEFVDWDVELNLTEMKEEFKKFT